MERQRRAAQNGEYVRMEEERRPGCFRAFFQRWRAERARRAQMEDGRERLERAIRGVSSKFRETRRLVETNRGRAQEILRDKNKDDSISVRLARAEAGPYIRRALDLVKYAERLSAFHSQLNRMLHTLEMANANVSVHAILREASEAADKLLQIVDVDRVEELMTKIAEQGDHIREVGDELGDSSHMEDPNGIRDEDVEEELARLMLWDLDENLPVHVVATESEEPEEKAKASPLLEAA